MAATSSAPVPLPGAPSWQELVEQQDGVLGRAQARHGGLSEDAWQWRLDKGLWRSVLHGVVVTHTGEVTQRQRAWAAVTYAGPGAWLSADAALVEHRARVPEPVDVHVVSERQIRRQRFQVGIGTVVTHRIVGVGRWIHPVRLPPVLRAPPALLQAAAFAATDRAAEWRVAAAVQQRVVRPADLRRALAEMPGLRRRGLVATVLDDVEQGAHAASELDFLRFLREYRLPAPDRLQRPVRTGAVRYLDAWWERQRVAVEVDGAHHLTVGQWDDDALRGNDVVIAERHDRVLLLRVTRANLRHDRVRVAEQLRTALC